MKIKIRLCGKCVVDLSREGFDLDRDKKTSEWSSHCARCDTIEPTYRWFIEIYPALLWEFGWAADARSQNWYATQEEAEEFIGNPRQFRRRLAGPWEPVE